MKNWRIFFVFFFACFLSAAIIYRLICLQIINYQYWRALAQGQQKFFLTLQGKRGEIFFQDKTPLAVNRVFDLVYAAPKEIDNLQETAKRLSPVLGMGENLILEKLKKDNYYEVIKKKISDQEAKKIKKLNLAGIYLGQERGREYPFSSLAAQVVGFLGGDSKGQYGIEGYYDSLLTGRETIKELEKGPGGFLAKEESKGKQGIEDGADLVLTLDYNIQFMAEKILKEAEQKLEFEKGEIIVADPDTGKIIALANFPSFDPNKYSEVSNLEVFQNYSVQQVFEPGSVFKAITMAAAIDQGKVTPETTYIDKGYVEVSGHKIFNYGNRTWGKRTMSEVLERSINTGAVFAEQELGNKSFMDYLYRFGIFEKTGIDLQGEIFSSNASFKEGYDINFATASFGQGIEMTSIQLVRAISVIANGGRLMRPYLVEKIIKSCGEVLEKKPEVQNPSVISKDTAVQVTAMLINVVEKGYGKAAKVPGYYVAGKTGTAQVPWTSVGVNKKGYSGKTWQSFVGYAPALDPKFLILVKLYNPKTKTAEYSAAPVFGELAKYIIDYWKIPPDYED